MAVFGRFKLTDALPDQRSTAKNPDLRPGVQPAPTGRGKGKSKGRGKSSNAKGKPALGTGLAAEQLREAQGKQSGQERRRVDSRPHGRYRPRQPASRPPARQVNVSTL